jgi:hypothetical protein
VGENPHPHPPHPPPQRPPRPHHPSPAKLAQCQCTRLDPVNIGIKGVVFGTGGIRSTLNSLVMVKEGYNNGFTSLPPYLHNIHPIAKLRLCGQVQSLLDGIYCTPAFRLPMIFAAQQSTGFSAQKTASEHLASGSEFKISPDIGPSDCRNATHP